MGEMSWNKVEEFIFTTVLVDAGGGEWSVWPINLLLCDRRNVDGWGKKGD
jgi:hypothetical protein